MAFRPTRHQGPGHCERIFTGGEKIPPWRQRCVWFAWRVESWEIGENELAAFPYDSALSVYRGRRRACSLPSGRLQGQINPALHLATAMAIIKLITFHFIGPEVKCKSLSSIYSARFYWHEILTTSRTWNKEERLAWEESAQRGKFKSLDDELTFLKLTNGERLLPKQQKWLTLLNLKERKRILITDFPLFV